MVEALEMHLYTSQAERRPQSKRYWLKLNSKVGLYQNSSICLHKNVIAHENRKLSRLVDVRVSKWRVMDFCNTELVNQLFHIRSGSIVKC
jgi:hypothetical protein